VGIKGVEMKDKLNKWIDEHQEVIVETLDKVIIVFTAGIIIAWIIIER